MPQAAGIAVENSFVKGLITEASGLNFPENACTDTDNCVFRFDGSVTRREGFDFEDNYSTKNIDRSNVVIKTYLWKNVAGNGDLTVLAVQIGNKIYFYKTNQTSLSAGAISSTVTLTPVSGAPATGAIEAQFAYGNGLLFVTHPYCKPMRISYDTSTDTATATDITIQIRDFEGDSADPYTVDQRPTATLAGLDVHHKYNLYNQGWGNAKAGNTGTGVDTTNLAAWDTSFTTMPSNADVMWRFKNSSDAFDTSTVPNVPVGNTSAPKGHFIVPLADQNRDTASGLSGTTATTTSYQRPSTIAWFAGRVFYSGINYVGFNANIYFTQIIERAEQYAFCYQQNDPTSEDSFDLLPSDGGIIRIPEAGTIFKLFTVPGGLVVFAANGIWFITGSTGLGFTATDYTVQKLTHIPTISASSFVDVMGLPSWWNSEGIYMLSASNGGLPQAQSLTDTTIKTFYDDIPAASKLKARGFYHNIEKKITWLYKSEDTEQVTEQYEFDRVLNFSLRTGAFFPWSIDAGDPKIHEITVTDASTGLVSVNNVVNGAGDTVIDASSNQVISFSVSGAVSTPADKYLISTYNGSTYVFTFAETKNTDYIDWYQNDLVGVNYDSYFTTGYKLRGEAIRKFQSNWVKIYSNLQNSSSVSYAFQGRWDYANTDASNRWSSLQTVTHSNTDYNFASRRLKVRGHGTTLQFHVDSVDGENFDIIGWSTYDTANKIP